MVANGELRATDHMDSMEVERDFEKAADTKFTELGNKTIHEVTEFV